MHDFSIVLYDINPRERTVSKFPKTDGLFRSAQCCSGKHRRLTARGTWAEWMEVMDG